MEINHLDHVVLTVDNIDKSVTFYTSILGFELVTFDNRKALKFGNQKINLHQKGKEFEPKAKYPTTGSSDLCFISETKIEDVLSELKQKNI